MAKYVAFFVCAGIATFVLLFRTAKDVNAFVPTQVLIGNLLSSFAVYLLIFGFVLYFVLARVKWTSVRVGTILVFFMAFYFSYWVSSWPMIDGYAP